MENNEVTINGVSLASMGTTLLSGAYSALLTPPALKDFVENNDPLKDGTEIIVPGTDGEEDKSTPKLKERDVTLTFLIQGDSDSEFFDNYKAFVAILHRGMIDLHIPELNRNFSLIYSNSTQFANYMLNACKLAVKFREPNPNSISDGLIWPPSGEQWDNDLDELIKDFEQHKKDTEADIKQINKELDTLAKEDDHNKEEIDNALYDIEQIRQLIKTDGTLDEVKAAMLALGQNYSSLHALASTVKAFLEAHDTADNTINTWREIEDFLNGLTDHETLTGLMEQEHQKLKADFEDGISKLDTKTTAAQNTATEAKTQAYEAYSMGESALDIAQDANNTANIAYNTANAAQATAEQALDYNSNTEDRVDRIQQVAEGADSKAVAIANRVPIQYIGNAYILYAGRLYTSHEFDTNDTFSIIIPLPVGYDEAWFEYNNKADVDTILSMTFTTSEPLQYTKLTGTVNMVVTSSAFPAGELGYSITYREETGEGDVTRYAVVNLFGYGFSFITAENLSPIPDGTRCLKINRLLFYMYGSNDTYYYAIMGPVTITKLT